MKHLHTAAAAVLAASTIGVGFLNAGSPLSEDSVPNALARTEAGHRTLEPAPAAPRIILGEGLQPEVGADFWNSKDYLTFIQTYAEQAFSGDARAAFYIKSAVGKCEGVLENMTLTGTSPPGFEACARLAEEDPFAALPPREGGYPSAYWQEKALSGGDLLAQLQLATKEGEVVEKAKASDDPEVHFALGLKLPLLGNAEDSLPWLLIACWEGFDCRMSNPQVGTGCVEAGVCQADQTLEQKLREEIGDADLGEIQSRAKELSHGFEEK